MSHIENTQQFYVICQPGFETELEVELREFWPYLIDAKARPQSQGFKIINIDHGGILIETFAILAYQINFFSKIASRVLERVSEFRVRDFPKLKAKFEKINLDSKFGKNAFQLEVAASKSRLNNEKRISEIAHSVWKNISQEADFSVHIRMYDDTCTVSVDTSGPHLHFRYDKSKSSNESKWIGEAPIRETIAAFMVRKLIKDCSVDELAQIALLDPMAGSGTLLSEAHNLYQPRFVEREYSFQKFISCPKTLKATQLSQNFPKFYKLFKNIIASDNEEKMISILNQNLKLIVGSDHLKIVKNDLFIENNLLNISKDKLWIIVNPPYGERLSLVKGFQFLGQALSSIGAERIGIVVPVKEVTQLQSGMKFYKLDSKWAFRNGGIPVEFLVFIKREVL